MSGTDLIHNRQLYEVGEYQCDRFDIGYTEHQYDDDSPIHGDLTVVFLKRMHPTVAHKISKCAALKQNVARGLGLPEFITDVYTEIMKSVKSPIIIGRGNFYGASPKAYQDTVVKIKTEVIIPMTTVLELAAKECASYIYMATDQYQDLVPRLRGVDKIVSKTVKHLTLAAKKSPLYNIYLPFREGVYDPRVVGRDSRDSGTGTFPPVLLVATVFCYLHPIRGGGNLVSAALAEPSVTSSTLQIIMHSVNDTVDFLADTVVKTGAIPVMSKVIQSPVATVSKNFDRCVGKYRYQLKCRLWYYMLKVVLDHGVDPALEPPVTSMRHLQWLRWHARANERKTGFPELDELDTEGVINNRDGCTVDLERPTVLHCSLVECFIALYPEMIESAYTDYRKDFFPIRDTVLGNPPLIQIKGILKPVTCDLTEYSCELTGYMGKSLLPHEMFAAVMDKTGRTSGLFDVSPLYWEMLVAHGTYQFGWCPAVVANPCVTYTVLT